MDDISGCQRAISNIGNAAFSQDGMDKNSLRDAMDINDGESMDPTPPSTPPDSAPYTQAGWGGRWRSGESAALKVSAAAATIAFDECDSALREGLAMLQRNAAARLEAVFMEIALTLRAILDPLSAYKTAAVASNSDTAAMSAAIPQEASIGDRVLGEGSSLLRCEEKFCGSAGTSGCYDGTAVEAALLTGPNANVAQLKQAVQEQHDLGSKKVSRLICAVAVTCVPAHAVEMQYTFERTIGSLSVLLAWGLQKKDVYYFRGINEGWCSFKIQLDKKICCQSEVLNIKLR